MTQHLYAYSITGHRFHKSAVNPPIDSDDDVEALVQRRLGTQLRVQHITTFEPNPDIFVLFTFGPLPGIARISQDNFDGDLPHQIPVQLLRSNQAKEYPNVR